MIPNEPSGAAPDAPNPNLHPGLDEPQPSMMPLGTGSDGFGDADAMMDPLAGGGLKKKVPTGPLLILLVVGVAIAGLFSMRTVAKATASITGNEDIERLVDKFLGDRGNEVPGNEPDTSQQFGEAINQLSASYTDQQVALRNVQKNPFLLALPDAGPDPVRPGPKPVVDDTPQRIEAFRMNATEAAKRLRLTSIMNGASPMASINDEITMIGDEIEEPSSGLVFTVTAIQPGSVQVNIVDYADTKTSVDLTVVLSDDSGPKKKRSGRRG